MKKVLSLNEFVETLNHKTQQKDVKLIVEGNFLKDKCKLNIKGIEVSKELGKKLGFEEKVIDKPKGVSVAKKQPSRLDRLENKFDSLETKLDKFIDVQMQFNKRQDRFHNMLVQIPSIQKGLQEVKEKNSKTKEELER